MLRKKSFPSASERARSSQAQKIARHNSLLFNILRISPAGSIFCQESRRSIGCNIKKGRILQDAEEKNVKGRRLRLFLSRRAELPLAEFLYFLRHRVLQFLDPF